MNGSRIEAKKRIPTDAVLRPAAAPDITAVRALLLESALPVAGVTESFPSAYVVAVSGNGAVVGVAGLEIHGSDGLLRSVAVAPALRGKGLGEALVLDRLNAAREARLEAVHLLTTTATRYFERLGFRRAERAALPDAIKASVEFTSACPETAAAMSRPTSDAAELREEIRARYALAAEAARTGPSSCCGSGSSCGSSGDRRAPTALAPRPEGLGYDAADVATLPDQAVQASLGCGNPLALAELREGETVLDLGSGGGIDVLLSARRVGPKGRAYGVDMTDEMLSLARENQRKAGVENATFLRGTIESVPLPEASVDVVISNCVINLSTDKAKAIAEAHRVLKPGGRFAVADIVTTHPMPPAARRAAALWAGCVAGAMTIDEYKSVLAEAGFEDVEIEPLKNLGGEESGCCGAESVAPELAAWEGKVLSAFVRAVKPAHADRSRRRGGAAKAAVLALLALPAIAAGAPGDADRVRDAARGPSRAMQYVEHLTTAIGPRLTGSEGLERAAAWAKDRLQSFGLDRVRLEQAGTVPVGFDRERSTGEMIAPERRSLHFGTPAWTAGTRGNVRGPARRAPADASLVASQDLRGAWVLVPRAAPGTAPAHAALLQSLRSAGVAGLVFPADGDRILAAGDPNVPWEARPTVPVIDLYASEWADIAARLDAGVAVSLAFDLRHRFTKGPRRLHNVVGEIRGSRRPDEFVVVGAHLDSWDAATGATDNAAGVAATMEAARLLARAGVRPDRTIRFVLFTGEEQGLIGSTGYIAAHAAELGRTSAALILDGGAGAISGIQAPANLAPELETILAPIRSLDAARPLAIGVAPALAPAQLASCLSSCAPGGAASCAPGAASCAPGAGSCAPGGAASCAPGGASCAPGTASAGSGACSTAGSLCPSDHWPFLQAGVPAFMWQQAEGPSAYDLTHHTDLDHVEHVRAADVEHSARVVALAALALADHGRLLPREGVTVASP